VNPASKWATIIMFPDHRSVVYLALYIFCYTMLDSYLTPHRAKEGLFREKDL